MPSLRLAAAYRDGNADVFGLAIGRALGLAPRGERAALGRGVVVPRAGTGRDGQGRDGTGREWKGWEGTGRAEQEWKGMGQEWCGQDGAGMRRDGKRWAGMGWEGVGRDRSDGNGWRWVERGRQGGAGLVLTSVGSVAVLAQKRLFRAMPEWSAVPAAGGEGVSAGEWRQGRGGRAQTHPGGSRPGCWAPASALV